VSGADFTASEQDRKPLTTIFYRLERARRRIERIEADQDGRRAGRHKRQGPSARTIAALQRALGDDSPRVASLRHDLEAMIARDLNRDVDEIGARLTQAIKIRAQRRRESLRLIQGGRPERGGPPNDGDIPF
jgi:hypothetical protein